MGRGQPSRHVYWHEHRMRSAWAAVSWHVRLGDSAHPGEAAGGADVGAGGGGAGSGGEGAVQGS